MKSSTQEPYVSTTNACKLCKPLGACLAFRGIEGCIPFLHGSQGCATYMRRYIISHFREPIDIASSSLGEKNAVYGGGANLKQGLLNVANKYGATVIGVATTCLTETIGDDVPMLLREFRADMGAQLDRFPTIINVSTPSYSGTHSEGFHATVKAAVVQLAGQPDEPATNRKQLAAERDAATPSASPRSSRDSRPTTNTVNLLPGLMSAADLRHLKRVAADFGVPLTLLPDYSETLDGPALDEYVKIPEGGTPIAAIRQMDQSAATIEFGHSAREVGDTAGQYLAHTFGVPLHALGLPIGLRQSDAFFAALEAITGQPRPREYELTRGQLVDAYVDGHKYLFGKRAIVYGEEDLVVGLTAFLAEIGIRPVLCASGGHSGQFQTAIAAVVADLLPDPPLVRDNVDFYEIATEAATRQPDLIIGHSKGYPLARQLDIPLIRIGFPVHDRFGSQRLRCLGYTGTQILYDRIVNAVIEKKQAASPVGYSYL